MCGHLIKSFQNWFKLWFVAWLAPNHYPIKRWPIISQTWKQTSAKFEGKLSCFCQLNVFGICTSGMIINLPFCLCASSLTLGNACSIIQPYNRVIIKAITHLCQRQTWKQTSAKFEGKLSCFCQLNVFGICTSGMITNLPFCLCASSLTLGNACSIIQSYNRVIIKAITHLWKCRIFQWPSECIYSVWYFQIRVFFVKIRRW